MTDAATSRLENLVDAVFGEELARYLTGTPYGFTFAGGPAAPLPWVVVDEQGRRFAVAWDITVTELTPEVEARRAAELDRARTYLAEHGVRP